MPCFLSRLRYISVMFDSGERIRQALAALGAQLEFVGAPTAHLVLCGGSALFLRGFMSRAVTMDIDVLGLLNLSSTTPGGEVSKCRPLPEEVERAAKVVAKDLRLPDGWINAGPTDLVDAGLPEGLVHRLRPESFGSRLTVYLVDRLDQIHFKLYAAADQDSKSRHIEDLRALAPSREELLAAATWTRTQDPSEAFALMLRRCLEWLGYPDVAQRV